MSHTPVHVNLELVDENALRKSTGYWWPDVAEKKVSAVFDMTWHEWRPFKLAYGVQKGEHRDSPENLKWFALAQADVTMGELFTDTHLEDGYEYFLLVSKLPETVDGFANRNKPGHALFYEDAVKRYSDISSHTHPISCLLAKLAHYT
jgi:hypothetical protein